MKVEEERARKERKKEKDTNDIGGKRDGGGEKIDKMKILGYLPDHMSTAVE